ncbi:MAG: HlyD family efflux transporter periplasmic adaptor subunit [Chitinophagaceae bacterium]
MKKWNKPLLLYFTFHLFLLGCQSEQPAAKEEEVQVRTPVTVTSITIAPLAEYIELNATSAFLQKSIIKANTNGYIQAVNTRIGQYVKSGQSLFLVKTKESSSIGNSISLLDSTLHFSGLNNIPANTMGYITELNHQNGDYIQDGDQLAVISNQESFAFLLNLPYELKPYLSLNMKIDLLLPDGVKLQGSVSSVMPSMDAATQTQPILIRISSKAPIPENLVAKVHFIKSYRDRAMILPKAAILTDEAQSNTWVMRMIDTVTAVKVIVQKGITVNDRVEIISPKFLATDKILVSGNFGLPDTAKVIVIKDNP